MNNKLSLIMVFLVSLISCSSVQERANKKEIDKNSIISPKVLITVLKKVDFQLQTISNGILQSSVSAEMFFETPGILDNIYYNIGQYINKGSIIATLKNDR